MSSSTESVVRSVANSIDRTHGSLEVKEPWLPDRAELGSSRAHWYEEKYSNLRSSDICFIKEKGGMFDKFEVVLPGPEERAHHPPWGFHTFYINQLEMSLQFPLPRFIAALCQHIKISPSQLAPNSYSFLLALGVLLHYYNLTFVPYVLMQLVQVKRLGPEKFHLSTLAWGGEVIKCLTRAQQEAGDLHRSFDDAAEHFTQLETRLAEVEAAWAEEARVAEMHLAALETRGLWLEAEKKALAVEKEALEAENAALRAELDENKARAEEEAERLRGESINAWDLGKEAFLKSSEFGVLCANKALGYFKFGFSGCLAQFRANGYSKKEHPASFLDVKKALMYMGDEEEAEEEEVEEEVFSFSSVL
ncbi:hypothetical protein F511_26268 [Dorcoceras hygrometricum]|uniref:Uncharacterized protein n=1 Tax=Dorcoceras hygrometricum TaxID=472368 RepID=A0A2Z7BHN0_9LAMI|nr:hypothetical protein F511_26268 [Dorcoceras hygrometricum]